MEHHITTPVTKADLASLCAGDTVLLSGKVYTARDAAHERLCRLLESGGALPFPLPGSAVYYVGPTPERPGQIIGAAGPTTSGRMDTYAPELLNRGLKIMIGKGARSAAVKEAIVRNGAVYLGAAGGAGAVMAASVCSARLVCWDDLGCEAVRELTVQNMPLTVVIDALGNDLYMLGPRAYLESMGASVSAGK